jgi:hypothetical protein
VLLDPLAAFGGVFVCLVWLALTLAVTEVRKFVPAAGIAALSRHTRPNGDSWLDHLVAVQFTPTGALPAGAPDSGFSDA